MTVEGQQLCFARDLVQLSRASEPWVLLLVEFVEPNTESSLSPLVLPAPRLPVPGMLQLGAGCLWVAKAVICSSRQGRASPLGPLLLSSLTAAILRFFSGLGFSFLLTQASPPPPRRAAGFPGC